jgi:plastocyanin
VIHPRLRMARAARPSITIFAVLAAALVGGCRMGGPAHTEPPPPSGSIAVEAKEYTFTPSAITVPSGTVVFSIRNAGNEAHEFKILAGEENAGTITSIAAGTTEALTVELAAGAYQLICTLNGHDQLGMKGTLTVTGG